MVKIKLSGINTSKKRLADGTIKTYYYHRATGKPLRGEKGSPGFIQDYAAAEKLLIRAPKDNLSSLFHSYTLSPKFTFKTKSTTSDYVRCMRRLEDDFGTLPIAALNDPDVRRLFIPWHEDFAKTNGPRTADYHMSVLSAVLSWAHKRGCIHANHVIGFEKLHRSDRSDMIWMPEQIAAFMEVASLSMRKAMILALHTGQRQGDILRMSWAHYDGAGISVKQSKSGRSVYIPCTPALKAELDNWPRTGLLMLTTPTGIAYKPRYFKRRWKEASDEADINRLHFHDLRGTAITMLAEAGCSVPEIAAWTGHSVARSSRIIDTYLARTRHLAESATLKFQSSKHARFANRLQTAKPENSRD